jgi:hypothetical protein
VVAFAGGAMGTAAAKLPMGEPPFENNQRKSNGPSKQKVSSSEFGRFAV